MTAYPITMYGIREPKPGPRWGQLFDATWPAYRRFYLTEGRAARPSLITAGAALATHMPELLPTWARLSEQTGFDSDAAAFLTHWDLPAFAPAACSQAVTTVPTPVLVRNYDYAPALFERVSISTDYLRPVIGTGDCLWGLLDGMNDTGLIISLTYGGDRRSGQGFAIPLVVRYLLETCADTVEAEHALMRLPVAMTYNLTLVDNKRRVITAHVGPGQPPEIRSQPFATNHRWREPVDPDHAARYRSVERLEQLDNVVTRRAGADELAEAMLRPALHTRDYTGGFGTLYTADYRPADGTVTYRWPETSWTRRFDSPDDSVDVILRDA
jgi:predicted choloylglycine hydrolase